jgi:uncharacterized protein (TIGR00304 family)
LDAKALYSFGTALVLVGIIIIAVAAALILRRKSGKAVGVRGGGAIIIGPIPIVFGTDKESLKTIMLLSIILTALLIALVIALHFLSN